MRIVKLIFLLIISASTAIAQSWVSDLGNGTYKNPVLHADYSDPDVCRVGDDYYMVSSSFDAIPGLPILHSKDLVNWSIIAHALPKQVPIEHFEKTQHGNGVWAPSIRYHNNEFYIYYPDPDFGIYLLKSKNITGPWSTPILVQAGKGLIDPCPLWDDDGRVFLVHAFAGSRAGIKSVIVVKELNAECTGVISEGRIVYDGHELDPTIEGPKFYKRNGYYYIFAPAGGVSTGWQTVLRSRNVYGPYERKVVMHQGKTSINGPHQGAWVTAGETEDWFVHFQDKEAYGRVMHLQPMKWVNDWPVIGIDTDRDGIGEPVLQYKKPSVKGVFPVSTPVETDEFNNANISLAWQWQANPKNFWSFVTEKGTLRLYATKSDTENLWNVPHILMQKFPAEEFEVTTKLKYAPNSKNTESTGLVILGSDYAALKIKSTKGKTELVYSVRKDADKEGAETENVITPLDSPELYLRVTVSKTGLAVFSYSVDGKKYTKAGTEFAIKAGRWIGAKVGLYCLRTNDSNDAGYADYDWFRIEPLKK